MNMATYFMFGKYSHDSIKQISAKRSEDAMAVISDAGGELKAGYALLGEYDLVLLVDLPGMQEAMKTSVALAKLLGISFTTSPAMTIEEFDELVG
jgi:uncharacterized protein with GYD domain